MAQSEITQAQVTQLPAATASGQVGRLSQSLMAMVLGSFGAYAITRLTFAGRKVGEDVEQQPAIQRRGGGEQ